MTPRTAIILQARMGSRRLPGKVLADLAGRSLLAHCIRRLQASGLPVIVATTTLREDDAVVREAGAEGAETFRGDDQDVLGRYVAAALAHGVTEVIRATADNPAVDLDAPGRVLALQRRTRADHVIECGLPHGAAVEAVTTDALVRAAGAATDPYDREHVTPFVRRAPGFATLCVVAPGDVRCPTLRLTVDTADDLHRMRMVLAPFRHAETPTPLSAIIAMARDLGRVATTRPTTLSEVRDARSR
jgi:spore coat polysaccharide biosynthesis protein SpsF